MTTDEVKALISKGETSSVQFKVNVFNEKSIAAEMIAFANSKGGKILIGVDDKSWDIVGLSDDDLRRLANLLVNAANEHIKDPIFIETESVEVEQKKLLIATIPEVVAKPYKDKDGIIYLKNGANKRKVNGNEEISRLLQSSGYMYAEERLIQSSSLQDIDLLKFKLFYTAKYNETFEERRVNEYLENLRLGKDGKLTIAGALLFGENNEQLIPAFHITAIWFVGNELASNHYRSSKNFYGTLDHLYKSSSDFILSKIDYVQKDQSFNSLGIAEIPELVFDELLVNALIHRDYYIKDSIKIFIFDNRIEIISPGKLPNSLTEEQIKRGVRRTRNSIVASFAPDLLKYRGAGSGILRALKAYPNIDFFNDIEGDQFKVTIHRPKKYFQ